MKIILRTLPETLLGIYTSKRILAERMRYLHPEAAASLLSMESSGFRVRFSDIYRSAEASLAARGKRGTKPPGYSGHNFGFSVDADIQDCLKRLALTKREFDAEMAERGWYCHRADSTRGSEEWHYNFFGDEARRYLSLSGRTRAPGLEQKILDHYGDAFLLTVKDVQAALKQLGMYSGDVDGKFGPISISALNAFRRGWKLTNTGSLTPDDKRVIAFVSAEKVLV